MDIFKLDYELKKKGMSAEDLCKAIGISRSAYYRKRCGKTEFTHSEIVKICKLLNLESPVEIFFADMVS